MKFGIEKKKDQGETAPFSEPLSLGDEKNNSISQGLLELSIETEGKSIGVLKAEILAAQWKGKWYCHLILLCSAFLVGYAYGLDAQTRYVYTTLANASYQTHSLLTTVGVITSVAGAACQPVYARLSDVFGRLEIFIVSILFYVVGTIIESQAYDVQRFAGGSVLYQIGYTGVIIVIMFILADFSSLKWRLFSLFVPTFPFIINTWISGDVTAAIGGRWSWGIAMWAFIFPLACIPFILCMIHMRWLAGRSADWEIVRQRKRETRQSLGNLLIDLFWKLDIIGLLFLVVCLGCLLVPLTLAGGVREKWKQGNIIAPLVIGGVLVPVFVAWETWGAKHPIAPFHLLRNRGIWAALLICFFLNFISSVESSYLYTVMIVAVNETTKSATRISSLTSFVSTVAGVFYGLFVTKFKRVKYFIVVGCGLWMVALGLLYHYRSGTVAHSGIIGGLVVMGLGTTLFSYPVNVSMQSCTNHEHMAVIISLGMTTYRIGSAVGSAIAGAIWTQRLYSEILKQFHGNAELAKLAYGDPLSFSQEHKWGTTERMELVEAYRVVQRLLIMIALIFCAPMLGSALFLRNHELGNEQSNESEDLELQKDKKNLRL